MERTIPLRDSHIANRQASGHVSEGRRLRLHDYTILARGAMMGTKNLAISSSDTLFARLSPPFPEHFDTYMRERKPMASPIWTCTSSVGR